MPYTDDPQLVSLLERTLPEPAAQVSDPPPPYSEAGTENSPERPIATHTLLQPPDYRIDDSPPSGTPSSSTREARPALIIQETTKLSRAKEQKILDELFAKQSWRRVWGPKPKTLSSALNRAALLGTKLMVLALLNAGASLESNEHSATQTSTAVHEALRGPEPYLALVLLDHVAANSGVQIATSVLASRDEKGCTPLHVAAEVGETGLVFELVRRGAVVDVLDIYQRSPLHMAARYGRQETIHSLLDCGADSSSIKQELWVKAGATTTDELGSYSLISEALESAITHKRSMHDVKSSTIMDSSVGGHPDSKLQELIGEEDQGIQGPRQLSTVEQPSLPDYHPSRSYGLGQRSDMSSAAFTSMYDAALTPRRVKPQGNRSKTATSFLDTLEYHTWSKGCDAIYDEWVAQRKRSKKVDDGGMGFDPRTL